MIDSSGYHVGDVVVITVTVTDPATGALADSTPTIRAQAPTATEPVTLTATQVSLGTYEAEVTVTEAGEWNLDAKTSGPLQAAEPGSFFVRRPAIV